MIGPYGERSRDVGIYEGYALEIGANYLPSEGWTEEKNRAYIGGIIERGDVVLFAGRFDPSIAEKDSSFFDLEKGPWLGREIGMLLSAGYTWNEEHTMLLPPRTTE